MNQMVAMKQALTLNAAAYEAIRLKLRPGMTEQDFYQLVKSAYRSCTGMDVEFTGDFLTGERCSRIAGEATDRRIQKGDAVIADLLVSWQGGHCDTTRTFFMGEPDEEQKRTYQAVLDALKAGEKCLAAGQRAEEVFRTVSESLQANGCDSLPHHAGHGVGDSWYQQPYLEAGRQETLEPGMLIALEPGAYRPDQYGIRLENNYLITADGCINLFDYPLELEYFVIGCDQVDPI